MQCQETVYSIRNVSSAEEDRACGLREAYIMKNVTYAVQGENVCSTRRVVSAVRGADYPM